MKILEKGPGWNIEQKCTGFGNGGGGCLSKLLVEEQDIYVTANYDYIGDVDYFYTFTCPVCGKETDISEKDIPSGIKISKLEAYKAQKRRNRSI